MRPAPIIRPLQKRRARWVQWPIVELSAKESRMNCATRARASPPTRAPAHFEVPDLADRVMATVIRLLMTAKNGGAAEDAEGALGPIRGGRGSLPNRSHRWPTGKD